MTHSRVGGSLVGACREEQRAHVSCVSCVQNWNTAAVTTMDSMFSYAKAFNGDVSVRSSSCVFVCIVGGRMCECVRV